MADVVPLRLPHASGMAAWDSLSKPTGRSSAPGNPLMRSGYHEVALARYEPDGSLDRSFGTDGIASAPVPGGGDADVWAVHIDSAGRYVLGGDTVGASFFDSMLARFLPAGALDPTFGGGGFVVTSAAPDAG